MRDALAEPRLRPEGRRTAKLPRSAESMPSHMPAKRVGLGQLLLRCVNSGSHAFAVPSPCRLPQRGLSTPTHRHTGPPGRAAGYPGPHSSEKPEQSQSLSSRQTLRTDLRSYFEDRGAAGVRFGSSRLTRNRRSQGVKVGGFSVHPAARCSRSLLGIFLSAQCVSPSVDRIRRQWVGPSRARSLILRSTSQYDDELDRLFV